MDGTALPLVPSDDDNEMEVDDDPPPKLNVTKLTNISNTGKGKARMELSDNNVELINQKKTEPEFKDENEGKPEEDSVKLEEDSPADKLAQEPLQEEPPVEVKSEEVKAEAVEPAAPPPPAGGSLFKKRKAPVGGGSRGGGEKERKFNAYVH